MELFAAVDIMGGRGVRLLRGEFGQATDYGEPTALAGLFAARLRRCGTGWLHLVDLDAARSGTRTHAHVVRQIASGADVPVQIGGGVRDQEAVDELLGSGATRVVLGTAALEEPDLVGRLASRHPGRIAVGLDHRGSPAWEVAARGWLEKSGWRLADAARRFEELGAAALVVTAIQNDGTLAGPDLEGLATVLDATSSVEVVGSGGVGRLDHLRAMSRLRAGGRGLAGAIVGRALHDGRMSVEEAVAACAACA